MSAGAVRVRRCHRLPPATPGWVPPPAARPWGRFWRPRWRRSAGRSGRARSRWPRRWRARWRAASICWCRRAPAPASRWATWSRPAAPAPGRRRDRDAGAAAPAGRAGPAAPGRRGAVTWLDARYAVLKGRSNYACLHRIREGVPDDQGTLVDVPDGVDRARRCSRCASGPRRRPRAAAAVSATPRRGTPTGVWRQVSVAHRECLGAASARSALECFAERAAEGAPQPTWSSPTTRCSRSTRSRACR